MIDEHFVSLRPPIEWSVASRAFDGGSLSGDQYLVEPFATGTLVAVVDGLGHGPRAAEAAQTAIATLKGQADRSLVEMLNQCHEALLGSRGVVMSLASFSDGGDMTWLGVGNVNGLLLSPNEEGTAKHEWLLPRGGVAGYQLPLLCPCVFPLKTGDVLVVATDGLHTGFAQELGLGQSPEQMAHHIITHYNRGTDDAMVLVARFVGTEKNAS